jgi:hypothetical protein
MKHFCTINLLIKKNVGRSKMVDSGRKQKLKGPQFQKKTSEFSHLNYWQTQGAHKVQQPALKIAFNCTYQPGKSRHRLGPTQPQVCLRKSHQLFFLLIYILLFSLSWKKQRTIEQTELDSATYWNHIILKQPTCTSLVWPQLHQSESVTPIAWRIY